MISTISKVSTGLVCLIATTGLAACGSSGSSTSSTTPATSTSSSQASANSPYGGGGSTAPAPSGGGAKVDVASNPQLGDILVDAKGNTLYLFLADKGSQSTCEGACAQAWPPYTTSGDPTAGSGADAALLGTSKRSDGSSEVTYAGHPLYYYAGDTKPGDTNGNNVEQFGAEWYALTPKGANAEGGGKS